MTADILYFVCCRITVVLRQTNATTCVFQHAVATVHVRLTSSPRSALAVMKIPKNVLALSMVGVLTAVSLTKSDLAEMKKALGVARTLHDTKYLGSAKRVGA